MAENFPQECRHIGVVGQRLSERCAGARAEVITGRTAALPSGAQWASDERAVAVGEGAVGGAKDGPEFQAWQSHLLPAESLDEAGAFLSQPDSPIDNNMVERAPKKAILSRRGLFANHKNSPKCFALACMRVPHARAANRAYADVRMRESPISVAGPSPVR